MSSRVLLRNRSRCVVTLLDILIILRNYKIDPLGHCWLLCHRNHAKWKLLVGEISSQYLLRQWSSHFTLQTVCKYRVQLSVRERPDKSAMRKCKVHLSKKQAKCWVVLLMFVTCRSVLADSWPEMVRYNSGTSHYRQKSSCVKATFSWRRLGQGSETTFTAAHWGCDGVPYGGDSSRWAGDRQRCSPVTNRK